MEKIKFIEVASELGAGTRGASLGIGALKAASLTNNSTLFKEYPSHIVSTLNEHLFADIVHPYAKCIPQVRLVLERTCKAVQDAFEEGVFPIVLAGDHSTAAGTISGVKAAMPQKRLGVIWIDAHADLHTPYTTPSGNMHGMPLAIVTNIDNKECQVNEPVPETVTEWQRAKNIGIEGPKLEPSDIVFISMRSYEEPEKAIINRYGIRNFDMLEVRTKGVEAIAKEALQLLAHCDMIYVSFDVDSMDPEISCGTGTPVPDGISVEDCVELNRLLIGEPKVVCWEMVEINPTLDNCNQMAQAGLQVLEAAVKVRTSNGKLINA